MIKLSLLLVIFANSANASSPFIVGNLIDNGLSASQAVVTDTNKQLASVARGDLSDVGTDGITVGSGTSAVFGAGTTLSQHVADSTHNGFLLSTDWSTFNGKQAAGNYITALTGDATASGPGSAAATVVKVNGVAYGTSPGTNTVPVVTSANTVTYETTPVAAGGTGLATLTAHALQVGAGTSNITQLGPNASTAFPLVSGGASADPSYALLTVPGGGTGLATLTAHSVYVGNGASAPTALSVGANNTVLRGSTGADPAFGSLVGADLPNPSASTLGGVESIAAVSHNFLTAISTSGVPAQAQPAFTDISGTATVAQTTVATQALTTCTTARTVDWSTGNSFTLTLTSGSACTLTFSNPTSGQTITLWLTNGSAGGTATVVWPTAKWFPAGAPVMTTGTAALDVCTCTYNGSAYACNCLQNGG